MTKQYGAPLTGEQMKALRDAGLPVIDVEARDRIGGLKSVEKSSYWNYTATSLTYHLPADHPAYMLLEKGWLDGRNVALWFGGEEAPYDWGGGDVLLQNGEVLGALEIGFWWHDDMGANIIAYTRKAEHHEETVNACQSFDDTVTLNKMTEEEAVKASQKWHPLGQIAVVETLKSLGLIKPEPTIEERFWVKFPMPYTSIETSNKLKGWVKLALEFERD